MDSLKIGSVKLTINDDPDRVIEFDPTDVLFVDRFYSIYVEFEQKRLEYEAKAKEIDERAKEKDEYGLPLNLREGIDFLKEVCIFMREHIDHVFGAGTSQTVFGERLSLEAIKQFLEGIAPYVVKERTERTQKYSGKKSSKSMK